MKSELEGRAVRRVLQRSAGKVIGLRFGRGGSHRRVWRAPTGEGRSESWALAKKWRGRAGSLTLK